MSTKDRSTLKPCPLCKSKVTVTEPERGRTAIECKCGLMFELPPGRLENLTRVRFSTAAIGTGRARSLR